MLPRLLPLVVASLLVPALRAQFQPPGPSSASSSSTASSSIGTSPRFGRDVRPILSNNCFACHGPDAGKRKRGLRLDTEEGATAVLASGRRAITPGRPEESELLRRITAPDQAERMPPASTHKTVKTEEVEILRRWIVDGAGYAPHWAFVPPLRPEVPSPRDARSVRNPIDAFLQERLEAEGLLPAPEADPATLLRRLSLDLTGLPPLPEELDRFLADRRPDAYEQEVARLCASPRYAEHMARIWLDAARYGDTHGLHLDNVRTMWPYRDWVIRAFQRNQPFDQFTVEQLAGDLLPNPTRDQLVATGFNRCNPTTAEGGLIDAEYLAKYAMDRVDTTATVWMGLTLRCAQCHDHKFDPWTARDYYRMFAFFDNVEDEASDRNAAFAPPDIAVPTPEQEARQKELLAQTAALEQKLDAPDPVVDAGQRAFEEVTLQRLARQWSPLVPASALSRGGATLSIAGDHTIQAAGANPLKDIYEVVARTEATGIQALRIHALPDPQTKGVGRGSAPNVVLTGVEVEAAPVSDPLAYQPVPLSRARSDFEQRGFPASAALDQDARTGWAVSEERDREHELVLAAAQPFGFAGGTLVRMRLRFESQFAQHQLARFRLQVATRADALPARLSAWKLCGPFLEPDTGKSFATEYGPEHDPDASATFAAGSIAWREHAVADGTVHSFGEKRGCAHYLWRAFDADTVRAMTFTLGSDDGFKVWWNGELLSSRNDGRGAEPDQERITVTLRPGRNVLLLKVNNHVGEHGWFFRVVGEECSGLGLAMAAALATPAAQRSPATAALVRRDYRRRSAPAFVAAEAELAKARGDLKTLDGQIVHTMVMRERKPARETFVLKRGQYDQKGELVTRGTPAALPTVGAEAPTRLHFAQWLVSGTHPLTARVTVNRLWAQVFGAGIVRTPEDFGYQGEWPSHEALLDWLACELVQSGWDLRHMLTLMVQSAAYRRASRVNEDALRRDPENRLLARGPRVRLDAEVIRDQALYLGGLLVEKVGGPSVKPYQPGHLWRAVAYVGSNTMDYVQDKGEGLWRRSLYTFWKRTAAPASLMTFDAPSRESCIVRRARTNTPLQALTLLNDVQFVEAARGLAQRLLQRAGLDDPARLSLAFRAATGRTAEADELAVLGSALSAQRERFRADGKAAAALCAVGEAPVPAGLDHSELAAWTAVAQILINLDETVTRR